jgi:hypothetical protein
MNIGHFIEWRVSLASKIREWYVIAAMLSIEAEAD